MKYFRQIVLDEYFEPSLGRALRVTLAFVLPLIWGMFTGNLGPAVWISITAEILSNVRIRGAYPLKLLILAGAVPACAVCAALGTLAGGNWWLASLLMMALAFPGGFVRQSGDHGPGITVGVLLLYLLSLDHPGGWAMAGKMFIWALAGGALALLFTLLSWAFVPFSPFRRSVALTWKGLSDWLLGFSALVDLPENERPVNKLDESELAFRGKLSDSMETLSRRQALSHARRNRFSWQLVELRRIASVAGNVVSSLRAITDIAKKNGEFPRKLFYYLLENAGQAAHRIALSIITHRPEDAYTARLSMERAKQSGALFLKNIPGGLEAGLWKQQVEDLTRAFEEALHILDATTAQSGKMTFFLRNFFTGATIPQTIPWVRFEFNAGSFTFRFSVRLALCMGIGIAVYQFFHIPHGYWIAMTTMIILQPEFGATIAKAFNRIKGTVLGAITGSLIFLLHLPLWLNIFVVAVCAFMMTYYLLRNYAVAAFFITIMVIALFHLLEPVTWELAGVRVLNTLGGAGLAMLGGYAFLPLWEQYRFPALIREAIAANSQYLAVVMQALQEGREKTFNDFVKPRRRSEMTNNNAFLSLRRMEEEPEDKQRNLELYFIIAGHNIRITRLLNALNQQIRDSQHPVPLAFADDYRGLLDDIMERVGDAFAKNIFRAEETGLAAEGMIQKIKSIIGQAEPSPGWEIIADLLERIGREAVGLYYSTQQLAGTNGGV